MSKISKEEERQTVYYQMGKNIYLATVQNESLKDVVFTKCDMKCMYHYLTVECGVLYATWMRLVNLISLRVRGAKIVNE